VQIFKKNYTTVKTYRTKCVEFEMQPSNVTIYGWIYVSVHHLSDSTNSPTFPAASISNRGKLFTSTGHKQMSPETMLSRLKKWMPLKQSSNPRTTGQTNAIFHPSKTKKKCYWPNCLCAVTSTWSKPSSWPARTNLSASSVLAMSSTITGPLVPW